MYDVPGGTSFGGAYMCLVVLHLWSVGIELQHIFTIFVVSCLCFWYFGDVNVLINLLN